MLSVYDAKGRLVAMQTDDACTMQDVIYVIPALGVTEYRDVDTIEYWDDESQCVASRVLVDGSEVGIIK